MSDQIPTYPTPTEVPGLDYFVPDLSKPASVAQPAPVTALEQMYGYFIG